MHDQHHLTLRPITGRGELDLFTRLPYVLDAELAGDLAEGRRRPEWMWVALDGDRLLARAAWWGRPGDAVPQYLDVFDLADDAPADGGGTGTGTGTGSSEGDGGEERVAIGVRLLRAALPRVVPAGAPPPEYIRFVPPGWRGEPAAHRVVRERMDALERTGARPFVERLRLEWRAGTPVPEPSGRLAFRPVRDAEELVGLMARVLEGTLDAHSLDDLTHLTPAEAARAQYDDELARYTTPRSWWRVATLPDGEPAGFVIPARNAYHPVIAYIAVLPEHRGRGYIDDLLAEGTRILAREGVERIRAATDLGNTPMAASFARAGYAAYEHAVTMRWQ